jgi:hypothetical protein
MYVFIAWPFTRILLSCYCCSFIVSVTCRLQFVFLHLDVQSVQQYAHQCIIANISFKLFVFSGQKRRDWAFVHSSVNFNGDCTSLRIRPVRCLVFPWLLVRELSALLPNTLSKLGYSCFYFAMQAATFGLQDQMGLRMIYITSDLF